MAKSKQEKMPMDMMRDAKMGMMGKNDMPMKTEKMPMDKRQDVKMASGTKPVKTTSKRGK